MIIKIVHDKKFVSNFRNPSVLFHANTQKNSLFSTPCERMLSGDLIKIRYFKAEGMLLINLVSEIS